MLDPEYDDNREDIQSSLKRFEKMLAQEENSFFDLDTLEQIADHYFIQSQFDEGLKACDLGLLHFPYTLELIILKAQILGELTRTEEAMELIENSMILFPTDTDLKLVKGSLLSQLKQHEAAIDQFLQVLESVEDKDEVYFRIGCVI